MSEGSTSETEIVLKEKDLNLTIQLSPTTHMFLRNPTGLPQLVVFIQGTFIPPFVNNTLCTLLFISLQIQKEMIIKDLIYYFIRKIKARQRTNYNIKRDKVT